MRVVKFLALASIAWTLLTGAPASADTIYSVRNNDTLERIAAKHMVSVERILEVNPKLKNASLQAGMVIVVPEAIEGDVLLSAQEEEELWAQLSQNLPQPNLVQLDLNRAGDRHRHKQLAYRGGMGVNGRMIDSAHKYLGTPYAMGGTGNGSFDCSGFTMRMFQMYGVSLPRTADIQYGAGVKVPFGEEMPGDLVFFETYLPGPSHVGIYIGDGKFIHASSSKGVTVSRLSQPYYAARYLGARRVFKEAL